MGNMDVFRLHCRTSCWRADEWDKHPYVEWDFGQPCMVTTILTLGHPDSYRKIFVTKYKIRFLTADSSRTHPAENLVDGLSSDDDDDGKEDEKQDVKAWQWYEHGIWRTTAKGKTPTEQVVQLLNDEQTATKMSEEAAEIFKMMDKDEDGTLSIQEVKDGMK